MRIALAQFNPVVGDIAGNTAKMASLIDRAAAQSADLVVFAELSVVGYPPRDLLRKEQFITDNLQAVQTLAAHCTKIAALVGFVRPTESPAGRPLQNCAALLQGGVIRHVHAKSLLPTYDVFDETRYFEPGQPTGCFRLQEEGLGNIGISICEDLWDEQSLGRMIYNQDPIAELVKQKAQIIINMAASPFQVGKVRLKEALFARQAQRAGVPIVYVNQVGGNDELIFDGGSCVISPQGQIIARAKSFEEDLLVADLSQPCGPNRCEELPGELERLWNALQLGLRDYVTKCGFKSVVLGLSGGIDSAIVAAMAADAIGPKNVHAIAMPSRYSSDHSLSDAKLLAQNLGIHYSVIPIEGVHAAYEKALAEMLMSGDAATAEENVQARIRGNIIMVASNAHGHLALATGNKSEMSTGYCTLYGDMAGGLAPIGDVFKTEIFKLAREINRLAGFDRIPENIIIKPPSAELKPNQFDQDKLPPYELLDQLLERYVELDRTARQMIEEGFDPVTVNYVVRLVDYSEYKRKQAAPVLKATARAFGSGRRMPIAQKYRPIGGA